VGLELSLVSARGNILLLTSGEYVSNITFSDLNSESQNSAEHLTSSMLQGSGLKLKFLRGPNEK